MIHPSIGSPKERKRIGGYFINRRGRSEKVRVRVYYLWGVALIINYVVFFTRFLNLHAQTYWGFYIALVYTPFTPGRIICFKSGTVVGGIYRLYNLFSFFRSIVRVPLGNFL